MNAGRGYPQVHAQRLHPGAVLQPADPAAGVRHVVRCWAVVAGAEVGRKAQGVVVRGLRVKAWLLRFV
eukprot:366362-Chlamydomonas_euryale.AAC.10